MDPSKAGPPRARIIPFQAFIPAFPEILKSMEGLSFVPSTSTRVGILLHQAKYMSINMVMDSFQGFVYHDSIMYITIDSALSTGGKNIRAHPQKECYP
jgi:hypothetical protein